MTFQEAVSLLVVGGSAPAPLHSNGTPLEWCHRCHDVTARSVKPTSLRHPTPELAPNVLDHVEPVLVSNWKFQAGGAAARIHSWIHGTVRLCMAPRRPSLGADPLLAGHPTDIGCKSITLEPGIRWNGPFALESGTQNVVLCMRRRGTKGS